MQTRAWQSGTRRMHTNFIEQEYNKRLVHTGWPNKHLFLVMFRGAVMTLEVQIGENHETNTQL